MKQWLLIIMPLSLATSSTILPMDRATKHNENIGQVLAVAYLQNKTIALGTTNGCYVLSNPTSSENIAVQLHDQPTPNLITDNKRQKIGLLCKDQFFAYDTKIKKHIWSYPIHNNDGYSAAFSSTDDTIFVCNKGELISNKRSLSIPLPFTGTNSYFDIACHPTKRLIFYPSYESCIALIGYNGHHIATYKPKIDVTDGILSIICSPDGSHIAILTKLKNIYTYNLATKNTHQILHEYCNAECRNAVFLPYSPVIATLCDSAAVHFSNFKTNEHIGFTERYSGSFLSKKSTISDSMLAWSADAELFAVVIKNKCLIKQTPPEIAKLSLLRAFFAISCLRERYPLPTEIINLIARLLFAFY